jgi:hypothetical protein
MAVALRFRAQGAATRLGPMIVSTLAALVFPLLMALAASSDLITMRISNRLVAVLVVGFFVLAFAAQLPLQQIAMHTGLAVMVLAFGFAFFSFGWIGGGDAKLAAATSLWIGFGLLLPRGRADAVAAWRPPLAAAELPCAHRLDRSTARSQVRRPLRHRARDRRDPRLPPDRDLPSARRLKRSKPQAKQWLVNRNCKASINQTLTSSGHSRSRKSGSPVSASAY